MKDIKNLLVEKFKDKEFEKKYHRTAAFFRLADEVLLLRKKRGLTQKELAEKVGTTQTVISRLESASVKPSFETILKIAEALDAAVKFELLPLETIRQSDINSDEVDKTHDAIKGIIYYDFEHGTLGWDEKWVSSNDPSLSDAAKATKIIMSKHKTKMKIREFA